MSGLFAAARAFAQRRRGPCFRAQALSVVLGLMAMMPCLAGPSAHAHRHAAGVLVLSELSIEQDREVMLRLAKELKAYPGPTWVQRVQINPLDDDLARAAAVRQVLASRPWRLVIGTTAGISALVMDLAPELALIFRMVGDPVGGCMVTSWRRPGGHATGYAAYLPAHRTQIEVLINAYPDVQDVVVLMEDSYEAAASCNEPLPVRPSPPCRPGWLTATQEDRQKSLLHISDVARVHFLSLCQPDELLKLPLWLARYPGAGLVVPYVDVFYQELLALIRTANRLRRPAVYGDPRAVRMGGLLQVSPKGQGSAGLEQVRRILGGVSPGDIPIQRPDGFEVSLNLGTARTLGRPPSHSALRSADHLVR
jgi:putative ABC transport system substrate-binding protein